MDHKRKQRSGERGAALIEAAFITPIFFALIIGIIESGLLFRNNLTTRNAVQQAAREASVNGESPDADYLILRSVEHGLQAMGLETLEHVVVFHASGPGDTVPAECLASPQSTPACNRYTAADFFKELDDPVTGADTGNFRCGPSAVDRFWCPADRETVLSVGPDYVGVHIQTRHRFISGFFGQDRSLTATVIIRLEPTAA